MGTVVTGALVAVLAACTSHPSDVDRLRKVADLDLCPRAAGGSTSLPDLTFDCLGFGPSVHLGALSGTPTLVNVWGSWCGPCQKEVPALQAVYAAAHGRVRVLGVDTEDSHASALDFAAHVHMTYPSVTDDDGTFIRALGRHATPMTLFVDSGGSVVHTSYGPFSNAADVRAQVHRWLGVTV
jgi:cytochrome c biogenesis protein CcmG, thiol:disulfide interchange protein DsbE